MQIMTAAGKRYFSLFINITILTTQKEKFFTESAVTVSLPNNHVIPEGNRMVNRNINMKLCIWVTELLLKELLKWNKMPRLSNKSQSPCQECHILSRLTHIGKSRKRNPKIGISLSVIRGNKIQKNWTFWFWGCHRASFTETKTSQKSWVPGKFDP